MGATYLLDMLEKLAYHSWHNDDELNDYYNMTTDDNTISDGQLRRMLDSDDDAIIVSFRVLAKMFQYL